MKTFRWVYCQNEMSYARMDSEDDSVKRGSNQAINIGFQKLRSIY